MTEFDPPLTWLIFGTLAAAAAGTFWQRRYSLRSGLMDIPNVRSSHSTPTPRSGGVAIWIAATLAFVVVNLNWAKDAGLFSALLFGGSTIAIVGYLDDRFTLSALLRLGVHLGAASWVVFSIGGVPPLQFGSQVFDLGWTGHLLGVAALVWVTNLFNFMDGIDGIAASEAVFVCAVGAALFSLFGRFSPVVPAAGVFAAACAGFLVWNWPPAKIFMGDVGSGYLGFCIATLALAQSRAEPGALWVFLILGGVFFVDATCTLVRRMLRREHFYQAHRIHAYQWLARRFNAHKPVVWLALAINVCWLLPWGWAAVVYPERGLWFLGAALIPLAIATLLAGSGRREGA